MDGTDMMNFLRLIEGYVVTVSFLDSKTNTLSTAQCYTGTPEPEYYWILGNQVLYKEFSLNFEGKCYAYLCKNGKRIQAVSLDPASFALKKNEFVLFSSRELTIPE
jgi:hypothetical protein